MRKEYYQVISVRYLPATNYKPSRLKAEYGEKGPSIVAGYPGLGDNAEKAIAQQLAEKMGWENFEIVGLSATRKATIVIFKFQGAK